MIRFGQKTLATLLILSSFFVGAQRANAIDAEDFGTWALVGLQNVFTLIGNGIEGATAWATGSLVEKEWIADGASTVLLEMARATLVRSILDWARTGFNGSPAFVQNLKGYFEGIGDEIAAEFITGAGLDALCSPFALDIRAALILQFEKDRKNGEGINKCTFTDISKNIKNAGKSGKKAFTSEDFFKVYSSPVNTPQGAYADALGALSISITNKKGERTKLLDFGKGLLSKEECFDLGPDKQVCQIITPGDTIANSINKTLGLGQDALVTADEINEFVGAFIGHVMQKTLQEGITKIDLNATGTPAGFAASLPEFDGGQTAAALDQMIVKQKEAIGKLDALLKKLAAQCSSAQDENQRIAQYKQRGVYDIYQDVLARKKGAEGKLGEMEALKKKTEGATATETIEITNQATAMTSQQNVYVNNQDLDKLIKKYEAEINQKCRVDN
ncbi:hypothetical protein A3C89_02945 [Candidatus Kaiserbacteria bacterium RIFCSPHIGHO2_02_FULL_50_50]|uniref:Uncharacterized protein n=1 Tax=Candidatus Kaiserbacteria bacterium RIFCSPHIGHO2_02_FULL_50_50 TaxID=1798492 RepID=A0A1F6DD20_9BACT|nr:MAG: hypothetical protein A3C89_02945 [Candidatus Kaiserbacteria bacterium RIFCSPHIGHO2_02_FULL_50_50]OGG88643.1 MAG: hypothetical protein A3G62_00930 [Candidatus Kaiserbacteria bacterium RIFCSPLOWO2_12_FULL_50_10]